MKRGAIKRTPQITLLLPFLSGPGQDASLFFYSWVLMITSLRLLSAAEYPFCLTGRSCSHCHLRLYDRLAALLGFTVAVVDLSDHESGQGRKDRGSVGCDSDLKLEREPFSFSLFGPSNNNYLVYDIGMIRRRSLSS